MEAEEIKPDLQANNRNPDGTFKPGFSGNPAGKPVGSKAFTTKIRQALEKIVEGKDYSYEEAFIKSVLKNAIVKGDPATQRLIWNYLDGLPKATLDIGADKDSLAELTAFFKSVGIKKDD